MKRLNIWPIGDELLLSTISSFSHSWIEVYLSQHVISSISLSIHNYAFLPEDQTNQNDCIWSGKDNKKKKNTNISLYFLSF